jgi:hypothetical protein
VNLIHVLQSCLTSSTFPFCFTWRQDKFWKTCNWLLPGDIFLKNQCEMCRHTNKTLTYKQTYIKSTSSFQKSALILRKLRKKTIPPPRIKLEYIWIWCTLNSTMMQCTLYISLLKIHSDINNYSVFIITDIWRHDSLIGITVFIYNYRHMKTWSSCTHLFV